VSLFLFSLTGLFFVFSESCLYLMGGVGPRHSGLSSVEIFEPRMNIFIEGKDLLTKHCFSAATLIDLP
jgi:hypothetical protein